MPSKKSSPQLVIQWIDTQSLKPYETALRKNASAVEPVAASIRQFGFNQPIVVDRNQVIVVGMARWLAAQRLGMKKVPVLVAIHLTADEARGYRVADNQTATHAVFDDAKLVQEIQALSKTSIDLKSLGFDESAMKRMLEFDPEHALRDADEIPQPLGKSTSQIGDLWQIGEHRVLHGDSGIAEHVDYLMGGQTAHMVLTDPPYNVCVEPRSNNAIVAGLSSFPNQTTHKGNHQGFDEARRGKLKPTHSHIRPKDRPLANDFLSDEAFRILLDKWFANVARILIPGGPFYIWGGYANLANYPAALVKNGLYFSQGIVWDKMHPVLTRKDFMGAYELCFYGWREGAAHRYFGSKNTPDLWPIKKISSPKMDHITEKPVELALRCIECSSEPGDNIVDLFGGAGWTLIAAARSDRRAYLCESDGHYVDIILDRARKILRCEPKRLGRLKNAKSTACQNLEPRAA